MINNQKKNRTGSALLIIVLVCAVLLSSMLILWRSVSLAYESAMLNYQNKKNFYACEGLIWYGVGVIKKELVNLKQLSLVQSQLLYQGLWPKSGPNFGKLVVYYDKKKKQIEFKASVFGPDHLWPMATSTVLWQINQTGWQVLDWQNN